MLTGLINNPKVGQYLKRFSPGLFVFREGDDSQDLYILVSGELEVLKGVKVISNISEPGAIFGEMSFLLGGSRTASLRATQDTETVQVPRGEISAFMAEFPEASLEMARLLAQRLDETTRVSYGLSEFCDRLPDAVLLTDESGRLLSWNRAAESLYGIGTHAAPVRSIEALYEDPEAYRRFIQGASSLTSVREKVLAVRRPDGQTGYVSTSLTLLYDGHHNFQGVLSLGRDVTAVQRLEEKYRFTRRWVVPSLILTGLLLAAVFYGYPYYQRGHQPVLEDPSGLHTLLVKDFLLLKSLAAGRLDADKPSMANLLNEFMALQSETAPPYTGLLLLDETKRVIDAVSLETGAAQSELMGSNYGGIEFKGPPKSLHRVLVLYRTDADHPMGAKGLELAFRITSPAGVTGWLVFQMDKQELAATYNVSEEQLADMEFKSP